RTLAEVLTALPSRVLEGLLAEACGLPALEDIRAYAAEASGPQRSLFLASFIEAFLGATPLSHRAIRLLLLAELPKASLTATAKVLGLPDLHGRDDLARLLASEDAAPGSPVEHLLAQHYHLPTSLAEGSAPRIPQSESIIPLVHLPPLFDYQKQLVRDAVKV